MVGETLPLFAFYLQPAVGGRPLSYSFWRAVAEQPALVAIKIALRPIRDTRRCARWPTVDAPTSHSTPATTPSCPTLHRLSFRTSADAPPLRICGGLLGQWALWMSRAVAMLDEIHRQARHPAEWLALGARLTDANAAIFDARHRFAGCIPGIHEVLRRQGLAGRWTLDPDDSHAGAARGDRRVLAAYPDLCDDEFVQAGLTAGSATEPECAASELAGDQPLQVVETAHHFLVAASRATD